MKRLGLLLLTLCLPLWLAGAIHHGPAVASAAGGGGNVATFGSYRYNNVQATSTTITNATTFAVAANDYILAFIMGSTQGSSVTDGTNSLTLIRRVQLGDPYYVEIWGKAGCSANASATFTATFTGGSSNFKQIAIMNWSGVATASAEDGSASNNASDNAVASTSTSRTSQNITTANANDLLVSLWLNYNITPTNSGANGFTLRSTSSAQSVAVVDKMVTSTGTYPSGNFGTVGTTDTYVSFTLALKVP